MAKRAISYGPPLRILDETDGRSKSLHAFTIASSVNPTVFAWIKLAYKSFYYNLSADNYGTSGCYGPLEKFLIKF
jgi:hypothetical protein